MMERQGTFDRGAAGGATHEGHGPALDQTQWGYVIREVRTREMANLLAAFGGRFFGAFLLAAAIGLLVMPGTLAGGDVFGMKFAAMVVFTIFGGYLLWAGNSGYGAEFHVDISRGELRAGTRGPGGKFRLKAVLTFADISSVFLLRSKNLRQPARLFLRVGDSGQALEVAVGSEARLEALRDRLTRDLHR